MGTLTVTAAGTFQDPAIKPLLEMYRQVVAQRYTPCPPSDLSRMLAAPPYYVSRKVDGELWYLVAQADGVRLVAANGRVATGDAPVLTAASLPVGTVLAGELYVANDGGRERVGDVRSGLASEPDSLAFAGFDVIQHGALVWRESTYAARLDVLRELLPTEGAVHAIPVVTVEADADVAGLYSDIVEKTGAEGIVVRCSDGRALKVKPEVTLDLAILGYTSREGAAGPEVRSLLIGVSAGEDVWVPLGTVGNMSEGVDRAALLALLQPLDIDSSYRRAASTGQLYRMTRPEVLVECRVLDVQIEDSRGRPIRQPELAVRDGQVTAIGQASAATLLNALVLRLRTDKPDPTEGANWRQIVPYVPAPAGGAVGLPASEVIRRQVWTKTTKDKTDVRKLVVWKTNKDGIDPSYPAYVVHWTDYSAGRKAPLAREVRPAPTLEAATALADAMVADNIKKGWEEQGLADAMFADNTRKGSEER
jgi:hypothetical protein